MQRNILLSIAIFLIALSACATPARQGNTPPNAFVPKGDSDLDKYVARADDAFSWKVVRTIKGEGYSADVLRMVSQTWRKEGEVDRTKWEHRMVVIRPDVVKHKTGLLFITGGSHGDEAPQKVEKGFASIATESSSVVSILYDVPNQPLRFLITDTKERWEDDLLAHSWVQAMKTGDVDWIGQFAMAKSAVRAMDAVQELVLEKSPVERFVVTGASKRGWTTWLTAAVDRRVVAIAPIVIDLLNMDPSMRHHYAAYGFWSPALKNYVEHGMIDFFDSPEYAALQKRVDPYHFRDRFTMPKYLIHGSGDQFFLNDSWKFYYHDLLGEKAIRYVPNAGHGLRGSDALACLGAWYRAVVEEVARPEVSWSLEKDGSMHVETKQKPSAVKLWSATNRKTRDFRIDRLGPEWKARNLPAKETGVYVGQIPTPTKGWTGFFVEMTFDSSTGPMKFTSGVHVLPDTLPFKDKKMEGNLEPRQ